MKENREQIKLLLKAELRGQLQASAELWGLPLNAEVICRLRKTLEEDEKHG